MKTEGGSCFADCSSKHIDATAREIHHTQWCALSALHSASFFPCFAVQKSDDGSNRLESKEMRGTDEIIIITATAKPANRCFHEYMLNKPKKKNLQIVSTRPGKIQMSASVRVIPPVPVMERGVPSNSFSSVDGTLVFGSGATVSVFVADGNTSVVNHHGTKVTAASISPNGLWVATGDTKGVVWELSDVVFRKLSVGQTLVLPRRQVAKVRI